LRACCYPGRPSLAFDLDSLLIHSVGGPAAVEKLRSASTIYSSSTTLLNGMAGKMRTYVVTPNQLCVELDLGPISTVQAFDGTTAWQRDFNGQISELSGSQRNSTRQAYFQTFSFLLPDRLAGGRSIWGCRAARRRLSQSGFHPFRRHRPLSTTWLPVGSSTMKWR
jgi:hypothetical protein